MLFIKMENRTIIGSEMVKNGLYSSLDHQIVFKAVKIEPNKKRYGFLIVTGEFDEQYNVGPNQKMYKVEELTD